MTRLGATFAADVRVQYRNGFYAATAVVVFSSIVLLRWLPPDLAALLLPVVLLTNVLVNTFYFVSGALLLERVEGTFLAQSVTPLRDGEYLGSKVGTLTVLSLGESLAIATAVLGADVRLLAIAAGVGLTAVPFCLAGVAVVLRYASISEFLIPSVLYALLLTAPLLGVFGFGSPAWYALHPLQGPLALMQGSWPATAGELAYAVGYPLIWTAPAYVWSRRALERTRDA